MTRSYDELLAGQVRSSQSSFSSFNTYATQAAQIDNMLSDPKTGLTASLQNFINAYQTVANSPSTTAQRQALLSQAKGISQQLQNYNTQLQTYAGGIEQGISSAITQINTLTDGIAKLNQQIAAGPGLHRPDAEPAHGPARPDVGPVEPVRLGQHSHAG